MHELPAAAFDAPTTLQVIEACRRPLQ